MSDRPAPIRVALVDDHKIVTDMARSALEHDGVAMIVGVADRVDRVAAMIAGAAVPADVALVDYLMPDGRGSEAIRTIRRAWPNCRCILFSGVENDDVVEEVIASGADGIMSKGATGSNEMVSTVQRAARGEVLFEPSMLQALISRAAAGSFRGGHMTDPLTTREREALELLLESGETEVAAGLLGISASTYRVHLSNAMRKLGATSRLDAISRAIKAGVIRAPAVVIGSIEEAKDRDA